MLHHLAGRSPFGVRRQTGELSRLLSWRAGSVRLDEVWTG
jgi:hypothetical protein